MLISMVLALAVAEITPETAHKLRLAWTAHTKAVAPNSSAASKAAFQATPVLSDGRLFVITPFNQVLALNPETGAEIWRYDPIVAKDRNYSEVTARGVAVKGGRVFFGTIDARLISLDAETGKLSWQVKLGDAVGTDGNYQVTSPPAVIGNTVVVGSSIGDNGRAEMERGTVRAFDAKTGKLKWTWDPTPNGQTGAANAWSFISADEQRDLVFIPTGSASPDFYGGLRPGDNRHANSVVALKGSNGEFVWSFQVVHHDLWDYDVAARPELIDVAGRPAVGVLTKIGHYFLLDRLTGKPLLPVEERPVPKSDVEGESASTTQPFPLRDGVFTSQKFVPRPGWCADEFRKLRYEGLFTPPSLSGSLLFPGNVGGANWGSGAWDAERGQVIVAANRVPTAVRLIARSTFDSKDHGETGERWGREYARQRGTPYGMSRKTFLDPDGRPCNQEPWGALVAIDASTGKLRWEVPMPPGLGGPLAVNGVVFYSGTLFETKLRAFAAADGRKLWETDLPFTGNSIPGTYVWKGKRYIVIAAGGHGKVDASRVGDTVLAFTVD
ncbi:MAG TPA: PQQ-binding-like beta-propeller repeat protein [Bryobacteraceae bacterium]|nr:PQQ-binding-like beta-propeller repeat protein [Bryobacteraceae bacterium]